MARGKPIFSIRLDPALRSALEDLATQRQIPIADLIRLAIVDYLERQKA